MLAFIKREPVLSIAAMAAFATCFFTPPSAAYLGYIDFRTLALLYALMVAVAVLRKSGALDMAARRLYASAGGARSLALLLTALCFFSSMVLTNDVALLTFVPFAALVLRLSKAEDLLLGTVVLQTLAANLGSMLTPVGNPQNLYLYSYYNMSAGEFFAATAPATVASGVLIAALVLFVPKRAIPVAYFSEEVKLEKRSFALSLVLLALSLATVFRLLPWQWMLGAVILLLLVFDRGSLKDADFLLLLTFVCFFVFVGNLGEIEAVRYALEKVLAGRELLVGAAVSQVISNVPAAVLLSGFTDNAKALLLGVDIGGLGTPVASLASLISLRLYAKEPGSNTGRFLLVFTAANAALLIGLLVFAELVLI